MIKKENQDIEQKLENKWKISKSYFDSDVYTKSHYFLLPLLNNKLIYDLDFSRHYLNSYINDEVRFSNNENLLLHFKTTDIDSNNASPTWERLYNKIINLDNEYSYHYYVGNNKLKNEVMFSFKINSDFNKDLQYLYDGRYSMTSPLYKRKILHFYHSDTKTFTVLKGILNKEEWLREEISNKVGEVVPKENECWDTFISSREFFRYNYKD